ncbi:MAG: hypothetical protein HBSAPP03_08750 [Phycisphaerae bacterium]|nr:MAG: hypothetical protein HBSAPP03_08750 [Phycisphaerae bacterium]
MKTPRVMGLVPVLMVGVVGVVGLVGGLAGCQQYVSSPGVPTAKGIPENPNKPAALTCMVEAVRYVATRYPPGDITYTPDKPSAALEAPYELAINPPRGLRKSFYERLVKQVGPKAKAIAPENEHGQMPVFHVTRVWMRFQSATVDVLRPMPELGPGPDGKPIYQVVTVRLEGGMSPWRVVHARAWEPQGVEIPPAYYLPLEERVDQFEATMEEDQKSPPGRGSY